MTRFVKMRTFPSLLDEFKEFCLKSAHKLFILSMTDHYLDEYKKQGFGTVKCGEEARFKLSDYEISGKKGAKMRMNINHAKKAGIDVSGSIRYWRREIAAVRGRI